MRRHVNGVLVAFEYWKSMEKVWPTVHGYSVKTVTENASFQKRSPE